MTAGISWYCVRFRRFLQEIATPCGLAMTVVDGNYSSYFERCIDRISIQFFCSLYFYIIFFRSPQKAQTLSSFVAQEVHRRIQLCVSSTRFM